MKFTTRFIATLAVLGVISAVSTAPAAGYIKIGDIKGEVRTMEAHMGSEFYQMLEEESGYPTDIDSGTDGGWEINGGLNRDIIRTIPPAPKKPR